MTKYIILFASIFGLNTFSQDIGIKDLENGISKIERMIKDNDEATIPSIDSLLLSAKKINSKKSIKILSFQKVEALRVKGDYSSAINFIAQSQSENIFDDNESKIKYNLLKSILYYNTGGYDSSEIFNSIAGNLISKTGDSLKIATYFVNKANLLSHRGDYATAIGLYLQASEIYQNEKKLPELAQVYNNIGTENRNLKNFVKSIEYYNLAEEIFRKENDINNLSKINSNIGVSYAEMDSLNRAVEFYEKALLYAYKLNNPHRLAPLLLNTANIYEKKSDFKRASELFTKSLQLCKENNIAYGVLLNHANLGNLNNLMGNYSEALSHLDSALNYSQIMKLPKKESLIYERYVRVFKNLKDYKSALYYQEKFQVLSDSLMNSEKLRQIMELQEKYETAQKEAKITELVSKNSQKKLMIFYILAGTLVIIIWGVWVYFKKRLAIKENELLTEKSINLENSLSIKNKELFQKVMNIAQLTEHNNQIIEELSKISKNKGSDQINLMSGELKKLIAKLESESESSAIWSEFELRFKELHNEFFKKLTEEFPTISPAELKIISLIRMNLSSKEISLILNRSISTIENTRNSIRKKLNVPTNENLTSFILRM